MLFKKNIYRRCFNFSQTEYKQLKYAEIENQETIVLNEIPSLSAALISTLQKKYYEKGGTIIFIPDANGDLLNYNTFLKKIWHF